MNNTLKCQVVMLPTSNIVHGTLWLYQSNKMKNVFWTSRTYPDKETPQHLYLISDREVEEGDWMLMKFASKQGRLRKCWEIYNAHAEYGDGEDQLMIDDPKDKKRGFGFLRRGEVFKIEATTDKSLGLPLIPQSFVEEYVNKQGNIKEVNLHTVPDLNTLNRTMPANEVIIIPMKDSWNRDEVIDLMAMAIMNDRSTMPLTIEELKKEYSNLFQNKIDNMKGWFNKNY